VVDGIDQPAGDLLEYAEVENEEALGVYRAFHRHSHPVVVPVE
jgi:hypothetical protein